MPDADRMHSGLVQAAGDELNLVGRVRVADCVRSVSQGGIQQPHGGRRGGGVHRATFAAWTSATRTAAAVMMSRFPA